MGALWRDWAWLPSHIVDMMLIKFDKLSDYVCFSGTCVQWRYVAIEANVDHQFNLNVLKSSRRKLPMLIFKTDEHNDECRSLYRFSDEKTYPAKLPLPYNKRFAGSSLGWLFCVDETTMVVTLVNPFTNCCIPLPVFQDPSEIEFCDGKLLDYYITKGILSSDPYLSDNSFEVVLIYGGESKVAFYRSGMTSWNFTCIGTLIHDIIYYKCKLYGISRCIGIVEIDLHNGFTKTITPGLYSLDKHFDRGYLVESQYAELLLITRKWNEEYDSDKIVYWDNENYDSDENIYSVNEDYDSDNEDYESDESVPYPNTYAFKVFKMTHPIENGLPTWVEVNDIGQQAFFLGENHSLSVSTIEFQGCQPNSIYYTSEHHVRSGVRYSYDEREEDSGFFDLEDRKCYEHHVVGSSYKYVQPSIWFLPSPQSMD